MNLNTSDSDNGLRYQTMIQYCYLKYLVCYTAGLCVVTQCSRSVDTKNDCVPDYEILSCNLEDSPSSLT